MLNETTDDRSQTPNAPSEASEEFSFAFQPIVDLDRLEIVGQEALVRGPFGEAADSVLQTVRPEIRQLFDKACRKLVMQLAGRLGLDVSLHINSSAITPANLDEVLDSTRELAEANGVDPSSVVFEFGRLEPLGSPRELDDVRARCNRAGIRVLADNYGASEVGLKRLVVFQPDWLKLDRNLIQRIHCSSRRQALVHGLLATCRKLGTEVIASGIEEEDELDWLHGAGVCYAQGYLLGRPSFESLPAFDRSRFEH